MENKRKNLDNFSEKILKEINDFKDKISDESKLVYSFNPDKPFHINILLISNKKPE